MITIDPEQPTEKHANSRIPTFSTVEEEAEFWDNHVLTEFADELETATDVRFVRANHKKDSSGQLTRAQGLTPERVAAFFAHRDAIVGDQLFPDSTEILRRNRDDHRAERS